MKSRILVNGILILIVLTLVALLTVGCSSGKANKPDTSQPPQIPPQSTFIMDFSDFTQSKTTFNLAQTPGVYLASLHPEVAPPSNVSNALGDYANWGFAALNVGFWSLVGVVGLAIPVGAFVESLKQTPVKQPDSSWAWTYSITIQGVTYTAELHGKYTDSGVRWDMYITKQNEYTDFQWYYGESDFQATQGFWVLKDKPSNPNDLLRIEWHRNLSNSTGDIKYTNIATQGSDNGGYISFTVTKDGTYDRSYVIFNKQKNETVYIEWNSSTKAGRVKSNAHFNDNEWHYWDSSLKDKAG